MRDPEKRRHMARELSVLYRHHLQLQQQQQHSQLQQQQQHSQQHQQQQQGQGGAVGVVAPVVAGGEEAGEEEGGGGRRHVVSLHDAFANMSDGTVALMVEYMDGGSLQDIVEAVSACACLGRVCGCVHV